jgi:hypothetical protein
MLLEHDDMYIIHNIESFYSTVFTQGSATCFALLLQATMLLRKRKSPTGIPQVQHVNVAENILVSTLSGQC